MPETGTYHFASTGLIGFFLLYRSTKERIVAFAGLLCALFLPLKINDVYAIGSSLSIATVPIFMYLIKEKKLATLFYPFLFLSGVGIGFSHYLRAYSGIGVLLFMLILLLFQCKTSFTKKTLFIAILFLGTATPALYINNQCNKYKTYAEKHLPHGLNVVKRHTLWHTLYLGFGFINCLNRPGIEWDDGYGYNKAKSIDISIQDDDYNAIDNVLKYETFKLFKEESFFVLSCIFAKIGVLIFFLIKYASIFFLGILISPWFPKPWPLELAFIILVLFNALFPLIAGLI